MRLTLLGEYALKAGASDGVMTIEADSADRPYSPYHLLGGSLASCTWFLLQSWGSKTHASADDLEAEVKWEFAEEPLLLSSLGMVIRWPSLPDERRGAAECAALQCPVYHMLSHPPAIRIEAGS
jgi:uncharacterized OsmC-like protein